MTDQALGRLLGKAKAALDNMTPEEKKSMHRQQAISFVRGSLAMSNREYSEEFIAEQYDRLYP